MKDEYITISENKEPYHKVLTSDKVINIAGGTGSGKTTYCEKYRDDNNYILIDTDQIKDDRLADNLNEALLKEYLFNKYHTKELDIVNDFEKIYKDILDYYKDKSRNKTLVIDSAQFSSIKDISILKGEIIIIRTSVDECFNRCIERFKKNKIFYEEAELEKYKERKKGMYEWYKKYNELIEKLEEVK